MSNQDLLIEENVLWELEDILLNYPNEGEYGIILMRKAQVGFLPKLGSLEVYTDHEPPHFHIKTKRLNIRFQIEPLLQISGTQLSSKQLKNLEHWYFENNGKDKIIAFWNARNPNKIISSVVEGALHG